VPDHFYIPEGEALRTTGLAVTPYVGDAQHGAAIAGVVARAVDATPSPVPMDLVRLTVDMSRVVPLGLTHVETNVRRSGKRIQVVEATLFVDGEPYTRSEGLRIRSADIIDPADIPDLPDEPPPPIFDSNNQLDTAPWPKSAFSDAIDCTFEVFGGGRARYWLRLSDQLVEGELMTPATRAGVAADVALTGGSRVPDHHATNPDLTLSMNRLPIGEWIQIESAVRLNPNGWGVSTSALSDEQGRFATVTKSLLYMEKRS
jgi:hypothetical protein